eukprot:evm.model.scf_1193.2 EVM.evm.TU.scf_1193.2   scf_1193:5420-10145(-)
MSSTSNRSENSRVWAPWQDGGMVSQGRMPYVASITKLHNKQLICTGVLIHHLHVLTMRKCVEDPPNGPKTKYVVHLGHAEMVSNATEVHVAKEVLYHGDVALMRLHEESQMTYPHLHSDYASPSDNQENLVVAGFVEKAAGRGEDTFTSLQVEATQYFTAETCNNRSFRDGSVPRGHVCGFHAKKKSASCLADIGSPLLLPYKAQSFVDKGFNPTLDSLVGVKFHGAPCGQADTPDVYVDIRPLKPWIDDVIHGGRGESEGNGNLMAVLASLAVLGMAQLVWCQLRSVAHKTNVGVTAIKCPDVATKHSSCPVEGILDDQAAIDVKEKAGPSASNVAKICPMNTPFNSAYQRKMELRYENVRFPFLNLDMQVSSQDVVMFVRQKLGSGGSGVVYRGELCDEGRSHGLKVAIKNTTRSKLTRELEVAKILRTNEHPNIMNILGACLIGMKVSGTKSSITEGYIVMELMSHSLAEILESPNLLLGMSLTQSLRLLTWVAAGLAHMHRLNVVHGDMKPGNILLSLAAQDGHVEFAAAKLSDFDYSEVSADGLVFPNNHGTPRYMAPEKRVSDTTAARSAQHNLKKVDGRTWDMYGFGVVIFDIFEDHTGPPSKSTADGWMSSSHVQKILDLARDCISLDVGQRPTATEAVNVLESVQRQLCQGGKYHLSCSLTEIVDLLSHGSSESGPEKGLRYKDGIEMTTAIAEELHRQRIDVAGLTHDVIMEGLFIARVAEGDNNYSYKALFAPQTANATGGPRKSRSSLMVAAIDAQSSLRAEDDVSIIADLMDRLFLVKEDNDHMHHLPPELADLIAVVRKGGRGMCTYNDAAARLSAALDGGGEWLANKVVPCVRPG